MNRCFYLLFCLLHRVYKITLSPFIGGHCRFEPTCSDYALEAVRIHGIWRGSWLAFKRILRCQPCYPGGEDPVPPLRGINGRS